jgi:hypothetical protein
MNIWRLDLNLNLTIHLLALNCETIKNDSNANNFNVILVHWQRIGY